MPQPLTLSYPAMMMHAEILVMTDLKKPWTVKAELDEAFGIIAIHEALRGGGFTVTHVLTGCMFASNLDYSEAVDFAQSLIPFGEYLSRPENFDLSDPTFPKARKFLPELQQLVNAWRER